MSEYIKIKLHGGGIYIEPVDKLNGLIAELEEGEIGEIWTVEKIEMTEEEYSNLPEFTGH